jgi:predicted DNA-binding transcriptional regulator YafY
MSFVDGSDDKVSVSLIASPMAMEHWALQYLNHVEVTKPESLRERIMESINDAILKYKD